MLELIALLLVIGLMVKVCELGSSNAFKLENGRLHPWAAQGITIAVVGVLIFFGGYFFPDGLLK